MSEQFNIENSFQVRRMSTGSFAVVVLLFLAGFIAFLIGLFAKFLFMGSAICVILFSIAIYNLNKKHKTDELFIEIDASGIWTHNREVTNWSNYRCSYITVKYDQDYDNYTDKELRRNRNRVLQLIVNIEHYKDGESGYFIHQLFFNGSEDKVEQEVIDAIEFYYNNRNTNSHFSMRKMLR